MDDHLMARKRKSTSNLSPTVKKRLRQAWRDHKLVLFLGAGVSQPYGLPMWSDLVLTLLVDEYPEQFKSLWAHYRRPFGSWLSETYGLTPMMLARLSQWKFQSKGRGCSFPEYLRDMLYQDPKPQPKGATALKAVAKLASLSEQSGRRIPLIITLNFDDLLEQELEALGVPVQTVYNDARKNGNGLPILHPHGFLPSKGTPPEAGLVFAEDEYHKLSFSSIHWAQVEMLNALRNHTVLFIGLSMSDPNLRRLLDASHIPNDPPSHFLFRKNYILTQAERTKAARTINERMLSQFSTGQPIQANLKNSRQFESAINNMLSAQHLYDEQLFRDMGVEAIWYTEHSDIPVMLREIH
ncbi:MAG: SIR2 family protein [Pyrinomonadaceae bacterium]|nr:SIR2 family protein [Pyrinomonadaceae bacterium]